MVDGIHSQVQSQSFDEDQLDATVLGLYKEYSKLKDREYDAKLA